MTIPGAATLTMGTNDAAQALAGNGLLPTALM